MADAPVVGQLLAIQGDEAEVRDRRGGTRRLRFADPQAAAELLRPLAVCAWETRGDEVVGWRHDAPTAAEMAALAASLKVAGVGVERARRLGEALAEADLLGRVAVDPGVIERVRVPGVAEGALRELRYRLERHLGPRDVAAVASVLLPAGATAAQCRAVAARLADEGVAGAPDAFLRQHPYWPLEHDLPLNLAVCDRLAARAAGREEAPDSPTRLRAAVLSVFYAVEAQGHTAARRGHVVGMAAGRLATGAARERREQYAREVNGFLAQSGKFAYAFTVEGSPFVQRAIQAKYEFRLAEGILALLERRPPVVAEPAAAAALDPEQRAALRHILTEPLTILAGPAGTGKSHLLRLAASACGEGAALTATTGKAAQVLAGASGGGRTLHNFLGIRPGELTARTGEQPVLLVVDEASMLDASLAGALGAFLAATPGCRRVVLAGDDAQLPPVGPGQPFWDLAEQFPEAVVHLRTNHRTRGRHIADLGQAIRDGSLRGAPVQSPGELHVIPAKGPGIATAVHEVLRELLVAGADPADVLVLTAQHEGPAGDRALARSLRPVFLPSADPDEDFVAGDRVIQARSAMLDDGAIVANGTFGTVTVTEWGMVTVRLDDGRAVRYGREQAAAILLLAYGLTTHKAQGSQAPHVVVALDPGHGLWAADRAMAYTAVTRAQQTLTLVGDAALLGAAPAGEERRRTTLLRHKIESQGQREAVF